MMSLKLPNYPREFIDAYVKFMISKYINRTVRGCFLDYIKNKYKSNLTRTFGINSNSLIHSLIKEYYYQENYYLKITDYTANKGQDLENYIKKIVGTKDQRLLSLENH